MGTKPRSRAHARVTRFPMRFYLIAVCVVLLQCHPVCAGRQKVVKVMPCPCCKKNGSVRFTSKSGTVTIDCPVCEPVGQTTCSPGRHKEYTKRKKFVVPLHSEVCPVCGPKKTY